MADSYHIIDGQVVPYCGGRRCNDTDAWRDATPLELQLQEQLAESENAIAAQAAEIEALRAEVERVTCELMDAITRADKLAEALREAADDLERGIDARIVVAQLRARADLLREQEEGNE